MKNSLIYLLALVSLPICLVSCIEQIKVPVRTEEPILVVDGGITNQPGPYQIRLMQTGTFGLPSEAYSTLAVIGARIRLMETTSTRTLSFGPVPGEPGLYQSLDASFAGISGETYVLTIELPNGKTYRSDPETLPAAPPIKELTARYTDQQVVPNDTPFGYDIFLETDDPADQTNYYRWSAYSYIRRESVGVRNFGGYFDYKFCWTPVSDNNIIIHTDVYSNGRPVREQVYRSPIYTVGKHFVEVTQYALTREAYQFWRRFNEQRQRVGTIFDPLPSPIVGNIYNAKDPNERALGYFTASGISTKRLIIPGDTLRADRMAIETSRFIAPGDCRRAFYKGMEERPAGW